MIFSSIHLNEDMSKYPPAIQRAVAYLKETDFSKMEAGAYEIEGRDMYAQVIDTTTCALADGRPESHKDYLDVQFLFTGEEKLGFTPYLDSYEVAEYIKERDLIFYKEVKNEGFVHSTPGCFCVFFPEDVHRPGLAVNEPMAIRKVVVKINMKLI